MAMRQVISISRLAPDGTGLVEVLVSSDLFSQT